MKTHVTCYRTVDDTIKPEVSAIFEVNIPNISGTHAGTSFAAPQVTAALALLCQRYPALAASPFWAKSIVMSSANGNYTVSIYQNDVLPTDITSEFVGISINIK